MLSTSDIKKGVAIIYNEEPWVIIEFQHVKPGKGGAFIRTKLKNIKSGKTLDVTFKSGETFPEADVSRNKMQYLYNDGTKYFFMDDNYEQFEVGKDLLGDNATYLVEETKIDGVFFQDALFDVVLPKKMTFEVTSAPPGVKGDSASGATKQVEIETGGVINTPLFINTGDRIVINTETGDYVEREK